MAFFIYQQRTSAGEELKHCKPNGKRTCFVAGTLILTRTGYKKIEDIQVGDWVWSYNEQTGKRELKRVTKVFVRQTQQLVNLYLGNQLIQTTLEHPFRHQGKWIKANDLKAGDRLQLYQSPAQLALDSLARQDTSVTVYNFTVASNHNYFVGKQGVLVHNANGYDDLLARTNNQALKSKINALGDDKAKFLDDFKDVSDDVLAKFEGTPELVDGWKSVQHISPSKIKEARSSIDFLETLQNIKNDPQLDQHIFRGIPNPAKTKADGVTIVVSGKGVHHRMACNADAKTSGYARGDVKFSKYKDNTPPPNNNTPYKCNVMMFFTEIATDPRMQGWKTLKGKSFFPDGWSKNQIFEEISFAFKNKQFIQAYPNGMEMYIGKCSQGWKIQMIYNPTTKKIESAFPN